jgi:hypothetical protein
MSRPILWFIGLLIPGAFALVSLSLLPILQRPLSPQLDIYHLQACELPCWVGIVPGETTLGEVQTLLERAYPFSEYEHALSYSTYGDTNWYQMTRRDDGSYLWVSFNEWESAAVQTSDTIISHMKIITGPIHRLLLGDWYNVLGEPQALSVTWGNRWAAPNALYYRQGVRLTLTSSFDEMALARPSIRVGTMDIYAHLEAIPGGAVSWAGWIPYREQLVALMLP